MGEELQSERLCGTVEDIKFRNAQNGYTVLEIGCDDELVTAVGTFADISVGESVKLSGMWTFHPTFGRQFKVEAFEREMPATVEQLYNYLSAGAVKGIGPVTAEKIAKRPLTCWRTSRNASPPRLRAFLSKKPKKSSKISKSSLPCAM